ncbi:MAG TPA: hypothetical protein VHW66_16790 [Stellaceae bacterium]|nr:hypothetical protein [Stellaceae bacterium]
MLALALWLLAGPAFAAKGAEAAAVLASPDALAAAAPPSQQFV